jgi:hypothetical protein
VAGDSRHDHKGSVIRWLFFLFKLKITSMNKKQILVSFIVDERKMIKLVSSNSFSEAKKIIETKFPDAKFIRNETLE